MIYSDLPVKGWYLQMEGIVLPPIFSIIKGLQKRIHLDDLIFQGFLQKTAGCSMLKPWALSPSPSKPTQGIDFLSVSSHEKLNYCCEQEFHSGSALPGALHRGPAVWIWGRRESG